VDNPQLLCYSKHTDDYSNLLVTVVNLDPHHRQTGWFEIPTAEYRIAEGPFQAHDLLSGARYIFGGPWNYVELDPHVVPAHMSSESDAGSGPNRTLNTIFEYRRK
jgi:starch synthase (maltosyl-transferring)